MKDAAKEKHIYTVSEINKYIRVIIEDSFPGVWIEGEVANLTYHTSGHIYFGLRDATASLKCAFFRGANQQLKFKLKDGMKVICFGSLSVYEPRGDYQLIVKEVEPKGVGALQLQFQQLKEKLTKEGLFDDSHKVPIPYLPTRIGIVTSPTGAAIRDILNIARRRFANVEIIINPVKVQGADAKDEIAAAIRQFNGLKNIDVMIVTRGGGSLEDLWPFNEEVVARAIYESVIPVISAVGHEIDFTISDFVADFRAPTPSAAAELVIPKKDDLINLINTAATRLKNALTGRIAMLAEKLNRLRASYALKQPLNMIMQHEQTIDGLFKDLKKSVEHALDMRREKYGSVYGKLEAFNPLAILARGYSVTTRVTDGVIVKDAALLKAGDVVETKLGKGRFRSRVEDAE
jgi:exodeoxyribonuclease VII large subunit